jgi:hypothetical protein
LKIKWLVYSGVAKVTKKGGPKIYERSLKIIENKWRKNARFPACHYVIENKLVIVFLPLC